MIRVARVLALALLLAAGAMAAPPRPAAAAVIDLGTLGYGRHLLFRYRAIDELIFVDDVYLFEVTLQSVVLSSQDIIHDRVVPRRILDGDDKLLVGCPLLVGQTCGPVQSEFGSRKVLVSGIRTFAMWKWSQR
jgi:hypothetical protein